VNHLLGIDRLDRPAIEDLLDRSEPFVEVLGRDIPKVPALRGKTVVSLFYEESTRTRLSFETAAKRLSADTMTFTPGASSVKKGESLLDTVKTIEAMGVDAMVVRHSSAGAPHRIAGWLDGVAVVNGGDGRHEHPTQALLDAFTIRERLGTIEGLIIAICGDIAHSRVARSNVALLTMLGAQVRLIGPPTLMPPGAERWGATVFHDMRQGLKGADVVMMLRVQRERMDGGFFPSTREFFWFYGLDDDKLKHAKPGALVMHPGPMNRGVEIDSSVADNPNVSLIETQVRMGVAVRMAVLEALAETGANEGAA
jgi:aspartate carbamoyltransferase catalytic subunit